MPFAVAAAAVGAAGVIGASLISSNAAGSAAQTEASAANAATAQEAAQFGTTQQNLAPYIGTGQVALSQLSGMLGLPSTVGGAYNPNAPLAAPFNPSQASLAATPGYQFQMNQGTGAVLNAASALGGVNSGNTLKALTQYGQGLASTNYQQAFNNYLTQQQQTYNQLSGLASNGQNAATGQGQIGAATAGQIGSNTIGAGSALGAGQVASANALTGGVNSATSNMLPYLLNSNNGGGYGGYDLSGGGLFGYGNTNGNMTYSQFLNAPS